MKKLKKPDVTTKKLWKKLTIEEQKRWMVLYDSILTELTTLSTLHNKIKAHNLAYEIIWDDRIQMKIRN